jgi:ElaA protein
MGITFQIKTFNQLSTTELYAILQLRAEVFVVEQNCPYPDPDGKDEEALHLMGFEGTELTAYARLLKPGANYMEASIGRVVVGAKHRGKNYGRALMQQAITYTLKEFNTNVIIISAQQYLEKFYKDLGFVTESAMYLEDDIPHIKMRFAKNPLMLI